MRISTILAPVDFSPDSVKAAHFAAEMARRCSARLALLHVDHLPDFSVRMAERVAADVWESYMRERGVALHRQLEELSRSFGGNVALAVARDHTATAILRHVADHDFELVVMGPHGKHESEAFLAGSTVLAVAGRAACPVLVTRETAPSRLPEHGAFRRPLLAISNEKRAETAASLLPALVAGGATVDLVHVFQPIEAGRGPALPAEIVESESQSRKAIRARLAHLAEVIGSQGFECSLDIEQGTPGTVFMQRLAAQHNDLIIVGRSARPTQSGALGSLTQRLLLHSPIPVLVLADNL
jgi:nucleotide-binding universal stress UspA family protein